MTLQEEYADVYFQVHRSMLPPPEPPWQPPPEEVPWYEYWAGIFDFVGATPLSPAIYRLVQAGVDPFIDDLIEFWAGVKKWFGEQANYISNLLFFAKPYLESVWNSLTAGMIASAREIVATLTGVVTWINNIAVVVGVALFEDLPNFAIKLFQPVTAWIEILRTTIGHYLSEIWLALTNILADPSQWIKDTISDLGVWLASIAGSVWDSLIEGSEIVSSYMGSYIQALVTVIEAWLKNIWTSLSSILGSPVQWILDTASDLFVWLLAIKDAIWDSMIEAAYNLGVDIRTKIDNAIPVITESLRDVWLWLWDNIKTAFIFVVDDVIPAIADATSGALGWVKDQFVNLIDLAYNEIMDKATALVPITPERSALVAAGMFGSAVGFGTLAHSMALAVEAVPNLKYLGVHYLSAFVARMGSFGTISSATMGVIAALAIRKPFTYYMNSILRPTQPAAMDLQLMAVKPDISDATFREGMKYEGYTDFWIDAFSKTMYHEPSYFELSMLGEDEAATEEWIFTKARRRGYNPHDAEVFVRSLLKKITRDQRKAFYMQAFNAFKEGFIDNDRFEEYLDILEIRPEAKDLSVRAADLAYQADLAKDLIATHKKAFADGITTEYDFRLSLSVLGLTEERLDAIVNLELIKRQPKIARAERKEIETEWRKVQSSYSKLYVESFRRGLIEEDQLSAYLIAIGIDEQVAAATARQEAIKKVPRPKALEIVLPALPAPPEPPVYEQ